VARFRRGQIWWFPAWTLGVPREYFVGVALSLCVALAPALWTGAWADRAQRWALIFGELLALTTAVTALTLRSRRQTAALFRGIRDAVRVKPK
jgi:Na+(H+)/acetate symporter ActP